MTIPGDQLPAPPQKFGGRIAETGEKSKPYWPAYRPQLTPEDNTKLMEAQRNNRVSESREVVFRSGSASAI